MKATGIIRRVDDLGRVVIPKELRRTLHLYAGDPMEIYTADHGQIIFRKYSAFTGFDETAHKCVDLLAKKIGCAVYLSDTDQIVFSNRETGDVNPDLSTAVKAIVRNEKAYVFRGGDPLFATESNEIPLVAVIPIHPGTCDVIGSLLLQLPDNGKSVGEREIELAQYTAEMIACPIIP